MDSSSLKDKICAFLVSYNKHNYHLRDKSPSSSTDLFAEGWLNSLASLQLVVYLEKELSIRISPFLVTQSNFSSVKSIEANILKVLEQKNER